MPAHEPGLIHPGVYDQGDVWVDVHGREHVIDYLDQDYAENILVYMLRNAVRIRRVYMGEIEGVSGDALPGFGEQDEEHAAHWMLRTATAIAIMRRLSDIYKWLYEEV